MERSITRQLRATRLPDHVAARAAVDRSEVDAREATALVAPADLVERIALGQDFGGVILGILHGLIGQALAARRSPIAARVVRDAPADDEADLRRGDAAHRELDQVIEAEPGAEMAELSRPLDRAADTHADAFDPVLVPIESCHPLAPHLAQAIEAVGVEIAVEVELLVDAMHADRVVGAGEDDAPHAMPARAFVHRVQAYEVVLDDLG